jgi:hypothetical protein
VELFQYQAVAETVLFLSFEFHLGICGHNPANARNFAHRMLKFRTGKNWMISVL